MTLSQDGRLSCEQKEVLDRITLHPELRGIGFDRVNDSTVKLHGEVDVESLSAWVRDYGASLRSA